MKNARESVATILYGGGTYRRFTQDGPVLPDVWAEYLDRPNERSSLLIEPWLKRSALEVADAMRKQMGDAYNECEAVYNRTTVSCAATFKDLVSGTERAI
jgi:hypothetical protein